MAFRTPTPSSTVAVLGMAAAGLALATAARADIAVARVMGPASGSAFSNPGRAIDAAQAVPVTLRSAQVDIRVSRLGPEQLQAACTATFEIENVAAKGPPTEFMVAFPVTGLAEDNRDSGALRISDFSVTVDGARPPTVRRDTVYLGYYHGRHYGPADTPVNGSLDGRFGPPPQKDAPPRLSMGSAPAAKDAPAPELVYAGYDPTPGFEWQGMELADRSTYKSAYLWTQKLAPGAHQVVVVTYKLALRAQDVRYGALDRYGGDDGASTLPREKISSLNKDQRYYLFDYVLKSGATWEGPIGSETITVSAEEGLDLGGLVSLGRQPVRKDRSWVWTIVNERPAEDVLVALPL